MLDMMEGRIVQEAEIIFGGRIEEIADLASFHVFVYLYS
jgi:hypothetical protein